MAGEIHTLHEFFYHTEAVIYALAVTIVVGFFFFYRALTNSEGNESGS
ncbi:MAG: hypothetical protein ABIJ96_17930 [Elusimicrobiota bacterium]